ncbi:adenosylcobinamide amidohydrolase [Methanobrevibacter sp. YE315]|uniref:adenosylcobinamide amidohydrolase n=1 Tax=Methanobrevibacter sp. YE315 TaxID=1609968 RepID=UPI000764DDC6|nr:adenosylcobinamide amidohydrolase [Methanobrevibacter sp. YE315]AMD17936.1 adenosylcobinamide amidohydrolase [Methanobrevibacter sp. YE315]
MYSNRLIFKTSLDDEVFYLNDTIFVKFNVKRNGISTSKLNGGFSSDFQSVFNHHLSQESIDYLENHDLKDYLIQHCLQVNIDPTFSTGLTTLAEMENVSIVTKTYKNLDVTAITTAGVRTNAARAGDPAAYYEENGKFGTINTIILINANLAYETLLDAFMSATEAKTVALNDLKIPSQYSNGYATGTGTDGLCVFSNLESDNFLTNAGKHSKLGEMIGQCVAESVKKAIKKQVWISSKSQSNALVRLNRYTLDINEFYDNLNCDKEEFIRLLQKEMKKQDNVAITSSVLNLIDEVECGLIKKEDALMLAGKIIENCNSYPIKKLLEHWINNFV